MKKNGCIYICHTFYQVYVSMLKELKKTADKRRQATLMLSTMSTDFTACKCRVESTHLFREVITFEETRDYPQLQKYREDKGNIVFNMIARIQYTKKLARLTEPLVPVDLRTYEDIYVYCDADPIGYYLNYRKIPYHACEDASNILAYYDAAHYENRGHFKLKTFLSSKCNLIFVQNGYGKYCIDMAVNNIAAIEHYCPRFVEVPLEKLEAGISPEDADLILQAFVPDKDKLLKQIADSGKDKDKILILTEPLCSLDVRERLFRNLVHTYEAEGTVYLKPHPRDYLDYHTLFADCPQFDARMPMEVLNYFPGLHFKKVVGVWTEMKALRFADEIVRLGAPFMDKYEDPEIHRGVK